MDSLNCKLISIQYMMENFISFNMSFTYKFTSHFCIFTICLLLLDRLKTALSQVMQDCEEWIKTSSGSLSSSTTHADLTPTAPQNTNFGSPAGTSFGLKV